MDLTYLRLRNLINPAAKKLLEKVSKQKGLSKRDRRNAKILLGETKIRVMRGDVMEKANNGKNSIS